MVNLKEPGSEGPTSGAGNYTEDSTCVWEKLMPNKKSLELPENTLAVVTTVSMVCSVYLLLNQEKFKLRKLTYSDSYMFFKLFYLAMLQKLFLPKICRYLLKYVDARFINCEDCALLESFLTVVEIEILTHVCINRYVVAKYIYNGWPLKNHNRMYLLLCFFFAFVYSLPPVFGLGKYALDFDCESCSLDMILPKRWRYFVLGIWLLRSIKPAIFMILMLFWAYRLEAKFTDEMKAKYDSFFSRIVRLVIMQCLVHWVPMVVVRGIVIFSQLIGDIVVPHKDFFNFATFLYELAPTLITSAIVVGNGYLAEDERPFKEGILVNSPQPDDKKED
ncbi:hypothetical protein O0L34_g1445 [Tuta absoluta]|nr:hypothetical protein O0L34_g1445 [Tuta absoluta]